jgi:hypothetical protein
MLPWMCSWVGDPTAVSWPEYFQRFDHIVGRDSDAKLTSAGFVMGIPPDLWLRVPALFGLPSPQAHPECVSRLSDLASRFTLDATGHGLLAPPEAALPPLVLGSPDTRAHPCRQRAYALLHSLYSKTNCDTLGAL